MRSVLTFAAMMAALSPVSAAEIMRIDDLTATRERPLFTPGRRPPAQVVAPTPPSAPPPPVQIAAPEPPPFEMLGAAVGGVRSFVLLRKRGSGEVIRLRAGESAEGWRVGAVALRTVALEREGRQNITVNLETVLYTGDVDKLTTKYSVNKPNDNVSENRNIQFLLR